MKTPWRRMLQAAAAAGVSPEAFWRLSLREWRLLTEPSEERPVAMGREDFRRLQEAWPDE
ncbi:phage tail assembly chaperone [Brevundimonas sp. FT23042]|uniref:phage tail assembly chaperone n=1 Tax=Brevundimonas sp. FT23042 TaxID=3393749 RepID=UPI003B58A3FD